jgi:hypothetical protein
MCATTVNGGALMRRRLAVLLTGLTGLVLTLVSLGAPANALIGAASDGNGHPYVGVIFNDNEFCTATALSPRVLLTAAHCLTAGETDQFYASFEEHPAVDASGWPLSNAPGVVHGTATDISNWCGHDGTCGSGLKGFADRDLAIVQLDQRLRLSRYASLPTMNQASRIPKGDVTLVGYGTYAIDRGSGQPRFVYDPIVRRTMPGHLLSLSPELGADFLKYEAKGGSSGMCFGDSGGPVLVGDTVVAVNSFINGMCSSYAFGTRTDTSSSLAEIGAFL